MSTIYEPMGRAREYSPLALNYFKGCDHGCRYCYVPIMLCQYNSKYQHDTVVPPVTFNKIEESARKTKGCNKQILLSFTGDPYCNAEKTETRTVLEILNRYNHKVSILTKDPEKALKDLDVIKSFGKRIKIGATLTFNNEKDSKIWETGSPTPESRINGLKIFAENGIKTWASFEPVIIPEQSVDLLKRISMFIDHVKIGKLNNYKGIDKAIDWSKFIFNSVTVCRERNIPFYIKKDLARHNNGVYLSENELDQDYFNL